MLGGEGGGFVESPGRSGVVVLVEEEYCSPAAEVGDLGGGLLGGRVTFEQPADAILPQELRPRGVAFELGQDNDLGEPVAVRPRILRT